jgi:hypothetical protein
MSGVAEHRVDAAHPACAADWRRSERLH